MLIPIFHHNAMQIACHNSKSIHSQLFICFDSTTHCLIIRHSRLIIRQKSFLFTVQRKVYIFAHFLFYFAYFRL